jgi:hypothetical protein
MLQKRAMGIFSDYQTTENALIQLESTGFVMERVSVVGRDMDRRVEVTGAKTSDSLSDIGSEAARHDEAAETAKNGAIAGTTFGGVTGLLVGLGALAIPGVGPVMLAGAAATALATAATGGAIGAAAGSLAGGLVGLNVPQERANVYSDRVSQGNYLVIVEGSDADIAQAESIFKQQGIDDWSTQDGVTSHPDRTATPVQTQYLEH